MSGAVLNRTLVLVALVAACGWAGACTSAGKCKRGTENCRSTSSKICDSGLVLDADGFCVAPTGGTGGSGGSGGSGGTGGTGGSPPDAACAADDLPTACKLFCQAFCANQTLLCEASECAAGECDDGSSTIETCLDSCADEGAPCAVNACESQLAMTCEAFALRETPADETSPWASLCIDDDPTCVLHGEEECSLTCGTVGDLGVGADLIDNGTCDDGSDGRTARCARGTDCANCGPSSCTPLGDACTEHEACCGFEAPGAFCVELGTAAAPRPTCLRRCTTDDDCPTDFTCTPTNNDTDSVCAPN